MDNEQNPELEQEQIEETVEEETPIEEEKPKLSPEQIRGIKQRQFTKLAKELGVELPKPEEPKQTKDNDYATLAQKSYLRASGLSPDEFDLAFSAAEESGKPIDVIIETRFFKSILEDYRDTKKNEDATPKSKGRSGSGSKDNVDYWLKKGELPEDRALRIKVVNAKMEASRIRPQ